MACKKPEQSYININVVNDTIKVDELYEAEINIPYYNNILPRVFIISGIDTIPISYSIERKCAIFKSVGKIEGFRKYIGFAEFYNQEGKLKRESFEIDYYIKKNAIKKLDNKNTK